MKTVSWLLLSLVSAAGLALAQNAPLSGIAESTDPAKIADIERRAEEIAANAQARSSGTSAESSAESSAEPAAPAPQRKAPAKKRRMHKADKAKPAQAAPKPEAAS